MGEILRGKKAVTVVPMVVRIGGHAEAADGAPVPRMGRHRVPPANLRRRSLFELVHLGVGREAVLLERENLKWLEL